MIADERLLRFVARYLVRCFRAGRSPHMAELAHQIGMPPLMLSRRFYGLMNQKLGAFLRLQQVLHARRLLRWSAVSLSDVARHSGYETERSFYRAFRRVTGTTPLLFQAHSRAESPREC